MDITALPRTHVLKEFAEYTTDPDEKAKLLLMTSNTDEGREMYNGFIGKYFLHDFILFIKTNCEIRRKCNTNVFKTQLQSFTVPNQGNLLRRIDKITVRREEISICLLISSSKLQSFFYTHICLFSKKYFLN